MECIKILPRNQRLTALLTDDPVQRASLLQAVEGRWRSKGGQVGARPGAQALWAQALGAQQHTFCNHFKRVFKQKFRLKYA